MKQSISVTIDGAKSSSSANLYNLPSKKNGAGQTSLSSNELRQVNQQIQELNVHLKRNVKILTEIKDSIQRVCDKQESRPSDDPLSFNKLEQVTVEIRLIFLKIGEIDTLKEQFQAEALIQARWPEVTLKGTDMESFDANKLWNPLLFVDNAVGELKNDIWHKVVYDGVGSPMIYEMRKIKGVFLENLELNDFPVDVQDLSITLSTTRTSNEVLLIADTNQLSAINTHAFIDQQEWRLHEHVETSTKLISNPFTPSQNKHPAFSATCRAARRPGYFYWNVYFLIFFITLMSFATFSVTYNLPQNRLQLSFTLLLTAVTFKWVVVRCLPTISYLTTLDKYVLLSMFMLCVVCAWHAIVSLCPPDIAPYWDNLAFISLAIVYTLFHVIFFLWMYFVTYRRRRVMKRKDKDYLSSRLEHLSTIDDQSIEQRDRSFSCSAASTVLRSNAHPNSTSKEKRANLSNDENQCSVKSNILLKNRHALEEHQRRSSMRSSIHFSPFNSSSFQNPYSRGQQVFLTSSDFETMNIQ